jgi:hypothetical protein
MGAGAEWGEAIEICRELLADRAWFDRHERDHKITIIDRIKTGFAAAERGDPLAELVRAVFRSPNNLVNWRASQPFQRWSPAMPRRAARRSSGSPTAAPRWRSGSMPSPTCCRPPDSPGQASLEAERTVTVGVRHRNRSVHDREVAPSNRDTRAEREERVLAVRGSVPVDLVTAGAVVHEKGATDGPSSPVGALIRLQLGDGRAQNAQCATTAVAESVHRFAALASISTGSHDRSRSATFHAGGTRDAYILSSKHNGSSHMRGALTAVGPAVGSLPEEKAVDSGFRRLLVGWCCGLAAHAPTGVRWLRQPAEGGR